MMSVSNQCEKSARACSPKAISRETPRMLESKLVEKLKKPVLFVHLYEVDDGTEYIAVFDDFARLGTKVIYCQDLLVHE